MNMMRAEPKTGWKNSRTLREIKRNKYIYLMIFIPMVFYAVFKYIPLWNAQIAFRDFKSVRYGISKAS